MKILEWWRGQPTDPRRSMPPPARPMKGQDESGERWLVEEAPVPEKPKYELNRRLLVVTLVLLGLASGGLYLLHGIQLRRMAGVFLDRAQAFEEQGRWREAAEAGFRYLALRPDDESAQVRIALDFDRGAISRNEILRSCELLRQAMALSAASPEVRIRLAERLLEVEQWLGAADQAKVILAEQPKDPRALRVLAWAAYQNRSSGTQSAIHIAEALQAAVAANPDDIALAIALASYFRQDATYLQPDDQVWHADQVMDRLVEERPDDARCWLARGVYRLRYGQPEAVRDFDQAALLEREDDGVLIELAYAYLNAQEAEKARKLFAQVVERAPQQASAWYGLGVSLSRLDRPDEARQSWVQGSQQAQDSQGTLLIAALHALLDNGEVAPARQMLARLEPAYDRAVAMGVGTQSLASLRAMIDYGEARACLLENDWPAASRKLHEVLTRTGSHADDAQMRDLFLQANRDLAHCRLATGDPEAAARALLAASQVNRADVADMIAAGESLLAVNQIKQATELFRLATRTQPQNPRAWLDLARVELLAQTRQPPEQRNWSELERALARSEELELDTREQILLILLRSQAAAQQSSIDQALLTLRDGLSKFPDTAELQRALATLLILDGRWDEAQDLADHWASTSPESPLLLWLQTRLAVARGQFGQALATLQSALAASPSDAHRAIALELASLWAELGQPAEGEALLLEHLQQEPVDVSLLSTGSHLAVASGQAERMTPWLDAWKKLAGDDSLAWRYNRARQLLLLGPRRSAEDSTELRKWLNLLTQQQPNWPAVWRLAGQYREQIAQLPAATDFYRRAMEAGDADPALFQKVFELLCQQKRIEEAARYVANQPGRRLDFETALVATNLLLGETGEAARLAQQQAMESPLDPQRQLMAARALLADRQFEPAHQVLQDVLESSPNNLAAWLMLLESQLHAGSSEDIRRTLEQLAENQQLDPHVRDLLVARTHWRRGETASAEAKYRQLLQANSTPPDVLLETANFFEARDPASSEQALRLALEQLPDNAQARRQLAQAWLIRGNSAQRRQARSLVEPLVADPATADAADLRLYIGLLATSGGGQDLKAAIAAAEAFHQSGGADSPSDALNLARLYEADQRPADAEKIYQQALNAAVADLEIRQAYVEFLVRQLRYSEVDLHLTRLEDAGVNPVWLVGVRAACLTGRDQTNEVGPLLEQFLEQSLAEKPASQQTDLLIQMGSLASQFDQPALSERWLRRALEMDSRLAVPLLQLLSAQNRLADVVAVCESVWTAEVQTQRAGPLLMFLLPAANQTDLQPRVKRLLEAARSKYQNNSEWQNCWALLQLSHDSLDEAIAQQRRLFAASPNNLATGNNLAFMLALNPATRGEAGRLIDDLLRRAPHERELLDTRAVLWLLSDRAEDAYQSLAPFATAGAAVHRLHYAYACLQTKRIDEAAQVFRELPAAQTYWSAVERQWYAKLQSQFP